MEGAFRDRTVCLVVMCQFITFCDSARCLHRALPLFVYSLGSIEANVSRRNTGGGAFATLKYSVFLKLVVFSSSSSSWKSGRSFSQAIASLSR